MKREDTRPTMHLLFTYANEKVAVPNDTPIIQTLYPLVYSLLINKHLLALMPLFLYTKIFKVLVSLFFSDSVHLKICKVRLMPSFHRRPFSASEFLLREFVSITFIFHLNFPSQSLICSSLHALPTIFLWPPLYC